MRQLSKRLIAGLVAIFGFATVATALTLVVEYKPYGVPDHRREEYDQKVAQIHQHRTLLKELDGEAKPVAVVASPTHDFGMLDPHTTAKHNFVVRNEGEHPLALEVQSTSCKCTVGTLQNNLLPPGDSTTVTMTWNTGYQAEQYEQTATVVTNDPLRREIELKVRGEVRAECIVPDSIALNPSDSGELTVGSFVVYSQLWNDFEVTEVACGLESFDWHAEPISNNDPSLIDCDARSAWRIRVFAAAEKYGNFEGEIELAIRPDTGGDALRRTLTCSGKVRAPIAFYSPEIHKTEGLDVGTLLTGKEHRFHLVVRARGEGNREIDVLDVKPDVIQASMKPLSQPGAYRLTVIVPADCPLTVFNMDEKHGYVQVGDPQDKGYMNWFPLRGAVVTVKGR